jgi:hypothetical protein
VAEPVTPIEADLGDQQRQRQLDRQRQSAQRGRDSSRHHGLRGDRDHRHQHAQYRRRQQAVQEIHAQIQPQHPRRQLGPAHRQPSLQRNEQHGQQHQPQGQPRDIERQRGQAGEGGLDHGRGNLLSLLAVQFS